MHAMHLGCAPDVISSVLLDLTDEGPREHGLAALWTSYREWCEGASFPTLS